jgi:molybdopterin converting factor small subunit
VKVRVRYYVLFWLHAGRRREEAVELPDGATVAALVGALGERHGSAFAEQIASDGRLRASCWLLVNRRRLATASLTERLAEGDEVVLTTPMLVGG